MQLGGIISEVPSKLTFTNTVNGKELVAQFNPTQLTESLGSNWTALTLPGASRQPLQFVNTDNLKLTFDLFFLAQTTEDLRLMHRARLLLFAWCYPRNVSNDVQGGAPPRLLVTWPGMLSLEAVLRKSEIRHQRFNKLGQSVHFVANVSLDNITDFQMHFEDVEEDDAVRFGNPLDVEGLT